MMSLKEWKELNKTIENGTSIEDWMRGESIENLSEMFVEGKVEIRFGRSSTMSEISRFVVDNFVKEINRRIENAKEAGAESALDSAYFASTTP